MTAPTLSGSFVMVDPAHVAELGPAAAVVFARIVWRSEREGFWTATRATLSAETGLPVRAVRSSLDLLRERGWVVAEQEGGYDRTTTWRPVFAGQAQGADSVTCMVSESSNGSDAVRPIEVTESVTSPSLETGKTIETSRASSAHADEQGELLLLTVPSLPDDDHDDDVPAGPPKTAQTLVARWCDGYRSMNEGRDAHKAVMGRVAGQARNLAKACGDDHDSWVDAYHAAHAAGVAGSWDMTRHLVPQAQRRSSTARRNVFAEPAFGGPGVEAMERFHQMMTTEPPRQLGSAQ